MNKVILLLGPTAVGKTGAAILLAKALKTEIISADSMLVYRRMDIATAKPSPEELNEVPHHLINILSPDEMFSAGMFRERATAVIHELHGRNKIPVIAGGTGLYIRSLTRGLFEGPSADWTIREKLGEEEAVHGRDHLYRRLQAIDPEAAEKIKPGDSRRTIRAIEVALKGDKSISEFHAASTRPLPYEFIKIGLSRDRKELYRLIDDRVDAMIAKGLLHETEELLNMTPDKTAMQAIGYKEMRMYLSGESSFEEAVSLIKKRTRMYAKRQGTWFRKEPEIQWVDVTGMFNSKEIFRKIISEVVSVKDLIRVQFMNSY